MKHATSRDEAVSFINYYNRRGFDELGPGEVERLLRCAVYLANEPTVSPTTPLIKDILREIPDEEFRFIAESTDVGTCRARIASVLGDCPASDPAAPLIHAIADWERENGTVAAIMPEEYEDFCKLIAKAAVCGSARASVAAETAKAANDTTSLDKLLREYRATMTHGVLHSWATDMVREVPNEIARRDAKLLAVETTYENLMDLHDRKTATLRGCAMESKNLIGAIVAEIDEVIAIDHEGMNESERRIIRALGRVHPILRHLDRIIQAGDDALDRVMERVHSKQASVIAIDPDTVALVTQTLKRFPFSDIESAAGYLPGASHNVEIKPGVVYQAGSSAAISAGYPKGSFDWVNPFRTTTWGRSSDTLSEEASLNALPKFAADDCVEIHGGPHYGNKGIICEVLRNAEGVVSYKVKATTGIHQGRTIVVAEADLKAE